MSPDDELRDLAEALGGEPAGDEFQTRIEKIAGRKLGQIYWLEEPRPRDPMESGILKELMRLRQSGPHEVIKWKGSKVPRGKAINGSTIAHAQHGILRSAGGKDIGTYRRVVEFGGEDGDEQEIEAWPTSTPAGAYK